MILDKIKKISDLKINSDNILLLGNCHISWSFDLRKPNGRTEVLKAENMDDFYQHSDSEKLTLVWRGCRQLGAAFEVKAVWQIQDGLLQGNISWRGSSTKEFQIENIVFPEATMPLLASSSIFLPIMQGVVLHDIKNHIFNDKAPDLLRETPFQQMQFCACYSDCESFYFEYRDTEFYQKKFQFTKTSDHKNVVFRGSYPLPLDSKSSLAGEMPYSLGIGKFNGEWFEACQIYRRWALQQSWANCPKPASQIRDIAMWIWNRGNAEDVVPPVQKLCEDTGLPFALDWYWWHKNGYDTSYPDYWPPREGIKTFRENIRKLNSQGIYTQVYTNGMVWDMESKSWEESGYKETIKLRDGTYKAYQFNSFTGNRLAWVCGEALNVFEQETKNIAKHLAASDIKGLYLDMIGCESTDCCYNPDHKHAPGGGNYQVKGFRRMLKEIRKENPGLQLSTEYGSEAYMDLFDTVIDLCPSMERLGMTAPSEYVPAFNAVYHDKIAIFGNYALPDSIPPVDSKWPAGAAWKQEKKWHELYPDQFSLEIARTLIWGYQPTVANLRKEHIASKEFKEIYNFIVRTAQFYYSNRKFLFDGEMLSFGKLACNTSPIKFLSRFIFTKEGKEETFTKTFPVLLHSIWRAPDGDIGLILANYTNTLQEFKFTSKETVETGRVEAHSYLLICLNK
jgi:hypothetical protein